MESADVVLTSRSYGHFRISRLQASLPNTDCDYGTNGQFFRPDDTVTLADAGSEQAVAVASSPPGQRVPATVQVQGFSIPTADI